MYRKLFVIGATAILSACSSKTTTSQDNKEKKATSDVVSPPELVMGKYDRDKVMFYMTRALQNARRGQIIIDKGEQQSDYWAADISTRQPNGNIPDVNFVLNKIATEFVTKNGTDYLWFTAQVDNGSNLGAVFHCSAMDTTNLRHYKFECDRVSKFDKRPRKGKLRQKKPGP